MAGAKIWQDVKHIYFLDLEFSTSVFLFFLLLVVKAHDDPHKKIQMTCKTTKKTKQKITYLLKCCSDNLYIATSCWFISTEDNPILLPRRDWLLNSDSIIIKCIANVPRTTRIILYSVIKQFIFIYTHTTHTCAYDNGNRSLLFHHVQKGCCPSD